MTTTEIKKTINAPKEVVFDTVSDIGQFSKAISGITKIEFVSEQKRGTGTVFKETRIMNGREATTELEVVDYLENSHIRLISDAGGTIWDSLFTVSEEGEGKTLLTLTMLAKPYKFWAKIMIPLMKGMVKKAIVSDMDAVKSYCEEKSPS